MARKQQHIVHEGPMADRRGTGWREDAARLEALDQQRLENPMQTLPNSLTSLDKQHAREAKTDGGAVERDIESAGGESDRRED
jgi:hypothetical protein